MNKIKFFVFCSLFFCYTISNAADSYDIATGILTIPQVNVNGTLYNNVTITIGEVASVGSLLVPDTYDTYNSNNGQLTIPVVKVGSATYYSVVVPVKEVRSYGTTCLISTGCSKVGTPEVKGVLPGNGRISVMFNFMGGKITQLLGSSTTYATPTQVLLSQVVRLIPNGLPEVQFGVQVPFAVNG